MHTNPHLLIFRCGRGRRRPLPAIARAIVPETVPAGAVHARGLPLDAGRGAGHPSAERRRSTTTASLNEAVQALAVNLKRSGLPPTDSDGAATLAFVVGRFDIVLLVDGVHDRGPPGMPPMAPLAPIVAAAISGCTYCHLLMSQAYRQPWTSSSAPHSGSGASNIPFRREAGIPISEFKVKRRHGQAFSRLARRQRGHQAPSSLRSVRSTPSAGYIIFGGCSGYNRTVCVRDTATGRGRSRQMEKCHMIRSLPTLARSERQRSARRDEPARHGADTSVTGLVPRGGRSPPRKRRQRSHIGGHQLLASNAWPKTMPLELKRSRTSYLFAIDDGAAGIFANRPQHRRGVITMLWHAMPPNKYRTADGRRGSGSNNAAAAGWRTLGGLRTSGHRG